MAGDKQPKPGGASNYQSLANLSMQELATLHAMQQNPDASQNTDKFISKLPATLKQPIYIFEGGKLVKVYGKGETGVPISIGYDSKSERYFSLSSKGNSQHGSIYEVIANQTIGRYSTGDLLKMHSESSIFAKVVDINKTKANEVKAKDPSASSDVIDYTLLSLAQNQQKQVELSKETTSLLASMFRVAEKQTLEANNNSNRTVADLAQGFDHTGIYDPNATRSIDNLIAAIKAGYNESQQDSSDRKATGSAIVPFNNYYQEVLNNVHKIKIGEGPFVFKLAATMNQVAGGTARYNLSSI